MNELSGEALTRRERARHGDGRFGTQPHNEAVGGTDALASPTLNRVHVEDLTVDQVDDALRDLEEAGEQGAASKTILQGMAHAMDAVEGLKAIGAHVLVARDQTGRVRAAMSLVYRDNDSHPHIFIEFTGSTLPGSNRAMLDVAMRRAVTKNVPLTLLATTEDSEDYWTQHGAIRNFYGCDDDYYGYTPDMMRRVLNGERLEPQDNTRRKTVHEPDKEARFLPYGPAVCTCGAPFFADTTDEAAARLAEHIRAESDS